jgi:hypothetical protein
MARADAGALLHFNDAVWARIHPCDTIEELAATLALPFAKMISGRKTDNKRAASKAFLAGRLRWFDRPVVPRTAPLLGVGGRTKSAAHRT